MGDTNRVSPVDPSVSHESRNFFLQLVALTLTKFGDALISPKTTLTWLLTAAGVPPVYLSLLVPVRESGALLPQSVLAKWIGTLALRKWVWVAGCIGQAMSLSALALVVVQFTDAKAGVLALLCLAVFALFRAACSVAVKDVMGKTIAKGRRGRLSGWASSAAGLMTLMGAGSLAWYWQTAGSEAHAHWLLFAGTGLWLLAGFAYALIREPCTTGALENSQLPQSEVKQPWSLMRQDRVFRHFVIARACMLCSALATPYIVLVAQGSAPDLALGLPSFILASGLAALLSSPIWGRLSDHSSRYVMLIASLAAGSVTLLVPLVDSMASQTRTNWLLLAAFFLVSVAHAGIRVGRSTYVVDIAEGNQRTAYVSGSNTLMGVLLLVVGGLTAAITNWSVHWALYFLGGLGLLAAVLAAKLPETNVPSN